MQLRRVCVYSLAVGSRKALASSCWFRIEAWRILAVKIMSGPSSHTWFSAQAWPPFTASILLATSFSRKSQDLDSQPSAVAKRSIAPSKVASFPPRGIYDVQMKSDFLANLQHPARLSWARAQNFLKNHSEIPTYLGTIKRPNIAYKLDILFPIYSDNYIKV